MGELYNSLGQELNTVYTTYPVSDGMFAWVDPGIIPSLRNGTIRLIPDLSTMTYTLMQVINVMVKVDNHYLYHYVPYHLFFILQLC